MQLNDALAFCSWIPSVLNASNDDSPHGAGFLRDFTTHYMDPTEIYARFRQLATEFPNISQLITLPNKTNGYQRRAQANMNGGMMIGIAPPDAAAESQTVVLTSRAWGHDGGNDVTAEFRNPGVADSPLSVLVSGKDILVNLGTDATGAVSSTAAQVVAAINASAAAGALVVAQTFRGNAGAGIVQPRAKVNLSDFLDPSVTHGPYEYSLMRIGKKRDGSKVGVSCTASNTRASGLRHSPASRPPSSYSATTRSTGRRGGLSTTSTSSSCRCPTRTAHTTRSTTSTCSGAT